MPKRKKQFNKRKGILIFYVIFFIAAFVFFIFNDYGIIRYISISEDISQVKSEIQSTDRQIEEMNSKIDSLRNSEKMIEKIAREKYNMYKEGERPISIKEK
jgi:cell division protein FtsB